LNKEGVTIIVPHTIWDEASRCTRLGLMRSGALLAQDAPQELLRQSGKDTWKMLFCTLPVGRRDFNALRHVSATRRLWLMQGGTKMSFARIMALGSRIIRPGAACQAHSRAHLVVPVLIMTLLYWC